MRLPVTVMITVIHHAQMDCQHITTIMETLLTVMVSRHIRTIMVTLLVTDKDRC